MGTKLPRVQAYIPQEVYDRLEEFKNQRGLESISKAASLILETHFGLGELPSELSASHIEEFEDLRGKSIA